MTAFSMRALGGLLLTVLVGASCGSGAASADDVNSLCGEQCAWSARCGSSNTSCQSSCLREFERHYANYRGDFFEAVTECYRGSDCKVPDEDVCFRAGLRSISPDLAQDPVFQQCATKRAACKARDQSILSDEHCESAVALTGEAQDRLAGCYQLACEQASGCMKSIVVTP